MEPPRRYNHGSVSLRAADENEEPSVIEGLAAVFFDGSRETEYELWPGVLERIEPGAFDNVLEDDVRALFNHRSDLVLGRNKAGTLRLSVDSKGLGYEIDRAETTVSRDVLEHLKRGDVSGSSFAFSGVDAEWLLDEPIADGEYTADVRVIRSFKRLLDVGPVTYPAYSATTSGARSAVTTATEVRAEWEQIRGERNARERERMVMRLRALEL